MTNSRVGKTYLGINPQLTVNNIRLSSQNILNWQRAIDSARSFTNPRRKLLIDQYESIRFDGHLDSVMGKRVKAITNKKVLYQERGKEGITNDWMVDNVLETPWFFNMLGYAMNSKAWGHSLIEMIPDKGLICNVIETPRQNVFPEYGVVTYSYGQTPSGTPFRGDSITTPTQVAYLTDPFYSNYFISVGEPRDLGLLSIASQYVIYKRGGFGDWAQFAELFGMPFRVGKYNPYDDATRKLLDKALTEMGGAGHVIIPDGTTIDFHDNNGTGKSEVFKDMVHECNSEISKIFLGQTMTTDSGSSRSQSEVHERSQDEIILSDLIEMEFMLNWQFKKKIQELGYPVEKGKFNFKETQNIALDKRIEMDVKLATLVPIEEQYFYETYGITKPDGSSPAVKIQPNAGANNNNDGEDKKGKDGKTKPVKK